MFHKVYIDPRSTINYSSYYIQGLYDVFGKNNVCFSSRYFSDLKEIDILMAFVLTGKESTRKVIIDYRDQSDVIEDALLWSDSYAKINIAADTRQHPFSYKIINIPPSFAINIWNPVELLYRMCNNFLKAKIIKHLRSKNIHLKPKRWISNYLSLLKRQTLQQYTIQKESQNSNYVFFISTLWTDQSSTNMNRQYYLFACSKNQKIDFEGGFFINKQMKETASIPDSIPSEMLYHKYLSNKTYVQNIKRSIFVFNTPAVLNCHGWKLGEFLCLGKAIISTHLVNELPVPLEHGKHIYYANGEQDIEEAVSLLLKDKDLRCRLENNAKSYYENHASPSKVIERIINIDFSPKNPNFANH